MGLTIGEAYLQIKPSTEGMGKDIERAMGDAGESGGASFGSAFSSALGFVTKGVAAGVGAAAAGATRVTKEAVSSFAEYEQLVGGVVSKRPIRNSMEK